MDIEEICSSISKAIDQVKTHQIDILMKWIEGILSKYREPNFTSSSMKLNAGQRFICPCGRSFSTEITIRETTHVDASSPPATPMLPLKSDFKHQHYSSEPNPKRCRTSLMESTNAHMTSGSNTTNLIERISSSSMITSWPNNSMKTYENSPELIHAGSTRPESDIELSSDESRCLDDIEAVFQSNKVNNSNYIYTNDIWTNSSMNPNSDDDPGQSQQLITLKPVSNEPISPASTPIHDHNENKPLVSINRRPFLIAFSDSEACSPSPASYFKCTRCHESFGTLLAGQEHANSGLCLPDEVIQPLENSDSHTSTVSSTLFDGFPDDLDESIPTRVDTTTKAACPICHKSFSSVHTMIRHKTSIHDRQVRYGCNICGRFFFRKDKLTSHMVYHQDFDSYVCCFCSLGCKSRMLMRQHIKRDHVISGEDGRFNEILNRCQIKKSPQNETNMTVSYGTDQSTTDSKCSISNTINETDKKQ